MILDPAAAASVVPGWDEVPEANVAAFDPERDMPPELWEARFAEIAAEAAWSWAGVPAGADPGAFVVGAWLPGWIVEDRWGEASPQEAVAFLSEIEAAKARLDGLALEVTRHLVDVVDVEVQTEKARLPERMQATVEQAHSVVAAEVQLATGLGKSDCLSRVEFATAAPARTVALRDALGEGSTSWARAKTVFTECLRVADDDIANTIAVRVLAPPREGEAPLSWSLFRRRLTQALWPHTDTAAERRDALARRSARAETGPAGVGFLSVTGSNERVAGAAERVEAIARAVRTAGDQRSLDQLRSDIALDLLLFGVPDGPSTVMGAADWTGLAPAGLPAARVDVVVSLASLSGYGDDAGEMSGYGPVPAHVVRDLAIAEGSTWRRIVTDPITRVAVDAEVDCYRPPVALARYVRVRDGGCRAPGCASPARHTDLDHVIEHHHGGPTAASNLQTLTRGHHTPKTAGLWKATLARDGTARWTMLTGHTYTTHPRCYDDGLDVPPAGDDPPPF